MTSDDTPSEADESNTDSTVRVRHEWSEPDDPSAAVIKAIAATTNREPTAMPPLYGYIDPDALNTLLTPRTNDTADAITVSFRYEGVGIQIDSSGWVEVQPDDVSQE